jgi:SpoVK/Ycf46/Vps4 family AAA+-type ATPase
MENTQLINAIKAGYAFFYVQTDEQDRTIERIFKSAQQLNGNGFEVIVWDFEKDKDPEALLFNTLEDSKPNTIVIAKNFGWFLKDDYGQPNKMFCSFLLNRFEKYTTEDFRKVFIITGDKAIEDAIPDIIVKEFLNIEFSLPDENEIKEAYDFIVDSVSSTPGFETPNGEKEKEIIKAAKGMTLRSIRNTFAYAVVDGKGKMEPKTVALMKAADVEKTAGLHIVNVPWTFADLKGYQNVKDLMTKSYKDPLAKGIILLGPPGTGKSRCAYCFGNETKELVIELEVAELFGGIVGDTERLWRKALQIIKANSPCILIIDEIEKALPKKNQIGGDGGTTERSAAQFLKFLSDKRPEGIYIIATCNDITKLPPEWIRAGRWDVAPFFIDLPNEEERTEILKFYMDKYNLTGKPINTDDWTGAEIEQVCKLAKMMNTTIEDAKRFIIPLSKTMSAEIQELRTWAKLRTLSASTPVTMDTTKKLRQININ